MDDAWALRGCVGAWVRACVGVWCAGHGKLTKGTTPKGEQLEKCSFLKACWVLSLVGKIKTIL